MKILLSGGHLTPALAFLDYALAQKQEVVFVGRLWAQEQGKQTSFEKQEVEKRNVRFIQFSSGKISPGLSLLVEGPKVLTSFWKARKIFQQEKPDVFVSFGGYLAVPLALAAWRAGVPIVTHEQTRSRGLANAVIAQFATEVAVSYPDTIQFFPAGKTVLVGNPVRQQIFQKNTPKPDWVTRDLHKPLLYITGGSQGAQVINSTAADVLPELTKDWIVIHQCGKPTHHINNFQKLEERRQSLPKEQQRNYMVREWLSDLEQAWVYGHAHGVLTRAGANTVQELLVLGKPAIFVPLLDARDDEQTKNARVMVDAGAALLIPQKELSGSRLLSTLTEFQDKYQILLHSAQHLQTKFDTTADQRLYEVVQKVAKVPPS